ncbi:hypothetical protein PMAYCL1PPCAC_04969 [Pristionchus mayeri]|uniref:G protein-coupled receptor n=1 Tax=Pristionchus mayeri TaxID=1317129 RepID=A0AAN5CAE7_9BILA|nr:hypothetical protein PMAYCL1PPCAC_04969 [Pristionchus mayeri]
MRSRCRTRSSRCRSRCRMLYHLMNHVLMGFGVSFNALALLAIARNTPPPMRDYSIIIFNTSLNDLWTMALHLLLNGRLFILDKVVAHMSNGPCRFVSNFFCSVMYEINHQAIMQTCSLIAISFWKRTLTEDKGSVGWCRLQIAILLAYIPHVPQTFAFFVTLHQRETLESFISSVYGPGDADEYAVGGIIDASEPLSAYVIGHFLMFATIMYTYIFFKRRAVLGALAERAGKMSSKTREMHQSLVKVLSIHSLLPTCTMFGFVSMFIQMADVYHSVELERSIYTIATFPSIVNPVLTLYYIKPYRVLLPFGMRFWTTSATTTTPSVGQASVTSLSTKF